MGDGSPAAGGLGVGSRIAGYVLEEQIGQGGMAVVFRAHDERLGRTVALKVLAPALAADEAYRQRFIRESRAAAAVDDPHIIPVFEAGDADGLSFIAMRLVRGGDVRSLADQSGRLPVDQVADIVSQVASALDAAHKRGLVHRDVKPANMLLDAGNEAGRPDHVYLSDFGLSKDPMAAAKLTGTGQYVGTLDYMSPEQFSGRQVDARTDQYALACTAFELLSGAPPFERGTGLAVMYAHLSAPPPLLTSRRPELPADADDVFVRALAKVPDDRYETCLGFAEALRAAFGLAPYRSGPPVARPAVEVARPAVEVARPAVEVARPAVIGPADTVAWSRGAGEPTAVTADHAAPGVLADDVVQVHARATRIWWRSPMTVAAAVVLAAALGGGYLLLAGAAPAAGPRVIFTSDFRAGGWSVIPDAADGRYRNAGYEVRARVSGNIEIAVPQRAAGPVRSAGPLLSVGVAARSIGDPVQDTQYGITCRSDDQGNRYLFSVQGSNVLIVKTTHVGSDYLYTPLTRATSAPIKAGATVALRADCVSASGLRAVRLVFWVNGKRLLDVTDHDPLTSGTVGVFTNFDGQKVITAEAEFHDFTVSRLPG